MSKNERKLTYAERILTDALGGLQSAAPALVAGNRSGWLVVDAMGRWGADAVTAHAFDAHHARAIRKRLLDEKLPARAVRCTPQVGDGAPVYGTALFMTTPQSMPAELVLDQLQDIHAHLVEGGVLLAAFEGDPDDALKTMRLVWPKVNVAARAKHAVLFRAVKHGPPVKTRDFAATWTASVPGRAPLTFTSYPGCFCHRRADTGGLALAEIAAGIVAEAATPAVKDEGGDCRILDMGCGCGLVGLLVADSVRRAKVAINCAPPRSAEVAVNCDPPVSPFTFHLSLIDSHSRAIAAARENAARFGIDAEFILSDDGLPRGRNGEFDLFVGNPPYYSDYRIAEVFIETAYRALKPGGVCLTVVKTASGLLALQEKYFRKADVVKRRGYCVLRSVR